MRMVTALAVASNLLTWADLPAHTRALLAAESLDSPVAWRAAGRRRFKIFGIPRRIVELLDQIARGANVTAAVAGNQAPDKSGERFRSPEKSGVPNGTSEKIKGRDGKMLGTLDAIARVRS